MYAMRNARGRVVAVHVPEELVAACTEAGVKGTFSPMGGALMYRAPIMDVLAKCWARNYIICQDREGGLWRLPYKDWPSINARGTVPAGIVKGRGFRLGVR
jgi:hypothetical protein